MSTVAHALSLSDTQAFLQSVVVDHPVVSRSWLIEQAPLVDCDWSMSSAAISSAAPAA